MLRSALSPGNDPFSQEFFDLLSRTRDVRYLSIMAALCNSAGVAIESTQQLIIARIFDESHGASRILARLRMADEAQRTPAPRRTCGVMLSAGWWREGALVPIEEFCSAAGAELQLFLTALAELFVQLCLGRNYNGINATVSLMPLDAVTALVACETLPRRLRAAFTALVRHVYVDCEPFVELRLPQRTRIWDAAGAGGGGGAMGGAVAPEVRAKFAPLRLWAVRCLTHYAGRFGPGAAADDGGAGAIVLEVLKLVKLLLKFGVCADAAEVVALVRPVVPLLAGPGAVHAKLGASAAPGRSIRRIQFGSSEPDADVFAAASDAKTAKLVVEAIKLAVCEIVTVVADLALDLRLTALIAGFKGAIEEGEGTVEGRRARRYSNAKVGPAPPEGGPADGAEAASQQDVAFLRKLLLDAASLDARAIMGGECVTTLLRMTRPEGNNTHLVHVAFAAFARLFEQSQETTAALGEVQVRMRAVPAMPQRPRRGECIASVHHMCRAGAVSARRLGLHLRGSGCRDAAAPRRHDRAVAGARHPGCGDVGGDCLRAPGPPRGRVCRPQGSRHPVRG